MKLPSHYSPKTLLVSHLFSAVCWAFLLTRMGPGSSQTLAVLALVAGATFAVAITFSQARDDRGGDDAYWRRHLAGRFVWRVQSALTKSLISAFVVSAMGVATISFLRNDPAPIWWLAGMHLGQLTGWQHWQARWERLKAAQKQIEAEETRAAEAAWSEVLQSEREVPT